jgi:hypothetical protein
VEIHLGDTSKGNPLNLKRLIIHMMCFDIFTRLTDDGPICPVPMVINESFDRSNEIFLDSTLFMCLSRSGIEDLFM